VNFLARPRITFPGAQKTYCKEAILGLEGKYAGMRYYVEVQTDPADPDKFERRTISCNAFRQAVDGGARWDLCVFITEPDEDGGTKEVEIYWRRG
jgi:hypothetical protein